MRFFSVFLATSSFLAQSFAIPSEEALAEYTLPNELGLQGSAIIDRDALILSLANGNNSVIAQYREKTPMPPHYVVNGQAELGPLRLETLNFSDFSGIQGAFLMAITPSFHNLLQSSEGALASCKNCKKSCAAAFFIMWIFGLA